MREDERLTRWHKARALAVPIVFAAYPGLSLLARNIEELSPGKAGRGLATSVLASAILFLVLRLVARDWTKASLICSAALLVFFSYGHVYSVAKTWSLGNFIIGRHRYFLPLCLIILSAWIWYVLRRLKATDATLTFFGLAGLISLILPVYTIAAYELANMSAGPTTQTSMPVVQQTAQGGMPDIYYIILDGYAREDVLHDLYGLDNAGFLAFLEDQGFYVADDSRSNYMQTLLSFASSLNMRYLGDIAASMGKTTDDRGPLRGLLSSSLVRESLAEKGYRMVSFWSGYGFATVFGADVYLAPGEEEQPRLLYWSLNEFDGLLVESTMVRALLDGRSLVEPSCVASPIEAPYSAHRDRILYTLNRLEEIPTWEGDYFVFAHLISPHPPFVFGANGETLCHARAYSIADASSFGGTRDEYIKGYRDQLTYLNKLLEITLTRIIAQSEPPPIVILQSDHGPGAYTDWNSAERSNIRERLGILNAYYLPGGADDLLYASITPVNSFRVVLNEYFEGHFELLPDESYYSTWTHPYDFLDVTERVDTD